MTTITIEQLRGKIAEVLGYQWTADSGYAYGGYWSAPDGTLIKRTDDLPDWPNSIKEALSILRSPYSKLRQHVYRLHKFVLEQDDSWSYCKIYYEHDIGGDGDVKDEVYGTGEEHLATAICLTWLHAMTDTKYKLLQKAR